MRDMTDHVRTEKHVHDQTDKLWQNSGSTVLVSEDKEEHVKLNTEL